MSDNLNIVVLETSNPSRGGEGGGGIQTMPESKRCFPLKKSRSHLLKTYKTRNFIALEHFNHLPAWDMLDYSILAWGLQEISDDDPTLLECADADANGVEFGGLAGGGRACVGVGEPVTHANQVTTLCSSCLNWNFAGFMKIVLAAAGQG